MILDPLYTHKDFNKDVLPYLCNGIFIDTSVLKIFIDGFVSIRFRHVKNQDYDRLISILNYLGYNNAWNKFLITPHVLTEICRHIQVSYNKNDYFKDFINEIMPIFKDIKEVENVTKEKIIELINLDKPVIEIGDISLFVSIDRLIQNYNKTAVLVKDSGFNSRYENDNKTMIIDFERTYLNLSSI